MDKEIARFLDYVGSPEDVEILLIEDNLATIRLMESYFEAKGHNCKGVVGGRSGLYLLRNFLKPKVVLTNIISRYMTGYDVCKIIKSDPDLKSIPVIYFTTQPVTEVEKRLEDTKADGYILKPFNFSDFDGIFALLGTQIQRLEYRINEFLVLKLDEGNTWIYVKGKETLPCKRLAINEIHDETPEQEFWGHCSNLQAWYDHNYDTRLLHSNLAFPLLKALANAGDPDAKKVFKTEIAERFESGYLNTIISIFSERLLDYLNPEEKRNLIQQNFPVILKHIENPNMVSYIFSERLLDYLNPEEKKHLIQQNFPVFLKYVVNPIMFPYIISKRLLDYLNPEEKRNLIQQNFPVVLKHIKNPIMFPYLFKERLLDYLNPEQKKHLIQQNFPFVVKYVEKLSKHYPNMFPHIFKERLLDYLNPEEKRQLIRLNYHVILKWILKISKSKNFPEKSLYSIKDIMLEYLDVNIIKELLQRNFPVILKDIEKIWRHYPNM